MIVCNKPAVHFYHWVIVNYLILKVYSYVKRYEGLSKCKLSYSVYVATITGCKIIKLKIVEYQRSPSDDLYACHAF